MSNELITVEDYNTALINFSKPFEYLLNTNDLEVNESYSIDFIDLVISSQGNNALYSLHFNSELFYGGYKVLNQNDEVITTVAGGDSVVTDLSIINIPNAKILFELHIADLSEYYTRTVKMPPYIKLVNADDNEEALVGMINPMKVCLLFEASSENPIKIDYVMDKQEATFIATDNAPVLDLDLRGRDNLNEIKISGTVGRGDYNYEKSFNLKLLPKYVQADNTNINEILSSSDGVRVFEISEDLNLNGTYYINHNARIIGNNQTVTGDGYSFIIAENVKVEIKDLTFENADPCFIQKTNSSLTLTDCIFNDCKATDFNGLGSVVHCDVDLQNLEIEDDYITTIKDCTFNNCYGAISHSGQIIIDRCNIINDDADNLQQNAPYFIYISDGECSIRNSSFNISIDSDILCSNQINAKLGQCLFLLGGTGVLNNRTINELTTEDNVNFFGNPYNNSSHIFIKYYYPSISACVFASPIPNRENKSLCYALNGTDYIFKVNTQITRASWENENRNGLGG